VFKLPHPHPSLLRNDTFSHQGKGALAIGSPWVGLKERVS
jgi:hypothetical protein